MPARAVGCLPYARPRPRAREPVSRSHRRSCARGSALALKWSGGSGRASLLAAALSRAPTHPPSRSRSQLQLLVSLGAPPPPNSAATPHLQPGGATTPPCWQPLLACLDPTTALLVGPDSPRGTLLGPATAAAGVDDLAATTYGVGGLATTTAVALSFYVVDSSSMAEQGPALLTPPS